MIAEECTALIVAIIRQFFLLYSKNIIKRIGCSVPVLKSHRQRIVYTIVEMVKENDLNLYKYLTYFLSRQPNDKMSDE